jgi:nucleoid-associated protein YgaU
MSRYDFKPKAINNDDMYDKLFEKRGVRKINQYRTPKAKHVEQEVIDSIESTEYVWKYGDRYWQLAVKYYGDPKLWWVIAAYNRKPTELHIKLGETIRIPLVLADALQVIG